MKFPCSSRHGRLMPLLLPLALVPFVGCSGEEDDDDASDTYDTPEVNPSEAGNEFLADGTWALKTQLAQWVADASTLLDTSDYDFQTVVSYYIVTMETETDGSVTYASDLCYTELSALDTFPSDTTTSLNQGFFDASMATPYKAQVVPEVGAGNFTLPQQVELKGVNLANPSSDPLPTAEDYNEGEYDGSKGEIYDFDGDGNDGFNIQVEGAIDGNVWVIERYKYSLSGDILDNDSIYGHLVGEIEDSLIYSDTSAIPTDTDVYPDDDPDNSFFDLRRQADGYTCSQLIANLGSVFSRE